MESSQETRRGVDARLGRDRTGYTDAELDEMEKKLLALPAVEPARRRRNKQDGVRRLANAIATLLERGFPLEQVAESLCGVGLEITTPTLKSYLQRIRKEDGGKAGRRKAKRSERARAAEPQRTQATAPPAVSAAATGKASGERPRASPGSTNEEFLATDRKTL